MGLTTRGSTKALYCMDWSEKCRVIFSIRWKSAGFAWTYVYRTVYHDTGDRERSDCGWGCRVARSRNEICVTRGPTSPGLALLLLSSAQLGAVQFCAWEKGGTLYYSIMSFELYAPARARRCDGDREQIDRTNEERDGKRQRPLLSHSYELATPYSWINASLCLPL